MFTVQEYLLYFVDDVLTPSLPAGYTGTKATSLLFIPIGVFAFISAVFVGRLSDRIGQRKRFLIWSSVAIAVLSFIVGFMNNFYVVAVIVCFFGIAMGVFQALDYALVCDILPDPKTYARDVGVWHISVMLPQLIAAPVGGIILNQFMVGQVKDEGEKGGYSP